MVIVEVFDINEYHVLHTILDKYYTVYFFCWSDRFCNVSVPVSPFLFYHPYSQHNLGFEAEHHERALRGMQGVTFFRDERRQRFGVLTTHEVKHAMCTLTNTMLREKRVHMLQGDALISKERAALRTRLRDQLQIYSYQFKTAPDTFGKDRMALSGKVGGMKDDLCICMQLGIYHCSIIQGAMQME